VSFTRNYATKERCYCDNKASEHYKEIVDNLGENDYGKNGCPCFKMTKWSIAHNILHGGL